MTIIFQVTYDCNLRCTYCYQREKKKRDLQEEEAYLLIDDLFLFITKKEGKIFKTYVTMPFDQWIEQPFILHFFGGESTLKIDLIDKICDYFHKKCVENNLLSIWEKCQIELESNGLLFKTKKVQNFLNKYKDRLGEFSISIDGCKECHDACRKLPNGEGSYDIVKDARDSYIKMFNKAPRTKQTFTEKTIQYLPDSIKEQVDLGNPELLYSLDELSFASPQLSEEYYQAQCKAIDYVLEHSPETIIHNVQSDRRFSNAEKITPICGTSGGEICIGPEGKLSNCHLINESAQPDDRGLQGVLGDVYNGFTNMKLLEFLRNQTAFLPPFCAHCPIRRACVNCCATNLYKTGTLYKFWTNCGGVVADARAQLYWLKRVEELHLEDTVLFYHDIKGTNDYDPNYPYWMYNPGHITIEIKDENGNWKEF